MFDAQLLQRGTNDVVVLSSWMSRGGDNLIATIDLVETSYATLDFTVEVLTKNSEETGDGKLVAGVSINAPTKGQESAQWGPSALDELVRYRFTLSGSTSGWVLFRMLTPVWFDSVSV